MSMFEFDGISGVLDEKVKNRFEKVFDSGDEYVFELKDNIDHEEEGFDFNYTYAIRVIDVYEITGDVEYKGLTSIEVELVVTPESICDSLLDSILSTMGLVDAEELDVYDIITYGGASVLMAKELVPNELATDKVLEAMNAIEAIDTMKGFYLDRPWNMIGTTGWDTIEYALGERENLFSF